MGRGCRQSDAGRAVMVRRHLALLDEQLSVLQRQAGVRGLIWPEVERVVGLRLLADEMRAELAGLAATAKEALEEAAS